MFFEGETRAFLTLAEAREKVSDDELFVRRDRPTLFVGCEKELARVRSFLSSDQLFLVVHGAGGIGKTRLLVEAGEEVAASGDWQVLWANVASMTVTSAWFRGIVPERATLLLVDEPDDETLLRILTEQLSNRVGHTSKWKVAVAVRSPKDPVLRFLRAPAMRARCTELLVDVLPSTAGEAMCDDLLGSGPLGSEPEEWRKGAARELARRFSHHPVWVALAVHVLETNRDLAKVPQTARDLADCYLEEIVGLQQQAPPEQVRLLLRWVALLGPLNREDDGVVKSLAAGAGLTDGNRVRELLASLIHRRGLAERGAHNRLIELKPDIMRDHVLLRWLSVDVGYGDMPVQPSKDAKDLTASVRDAVMRGGVSPIGRSVLVALARTEMLLRLSDRPVPFLAPFFAGIHAYLESTSASARLLIVEVLLDIAFVRPADIVSVSRALRSSPAEPETIAGVFGSREISQNSIVLELAWLVFHAAMGAQTPTESQQVLEELCAIAECEAEIADRCPSELPHDGKRAAQLIGRALGGGPEFWSDFEEAAATIAIRLLDRVAVAPAGTAEKALLNALLVPAAALERERIWSEGYTVHIQRYVVSPASTTRTTIRKRVKDLLADSTVPIATRLVLWHVFSKTHSSASHCRGRGAEAFNQTVSQELLDDLKWAHSVLGSRRSELEELTAARELWEWHRSYDDDPALKSAGEELERLYMNNELAGEFEPLLDIDAPEQTAQRVTEKAAELAEAEAAEEIGEFIDRAVRFLGDHRKIYELFGIAWDLGRRALTSKTPRSFVKAALAEPTPSPRAEFAIRIAVGWVAAVRKGAAPQTAYQLVAELADLCGSDELKTELIRSLYRTPPRPDLGEFGPAEQDYVRSLAPLFLRNSKGPEFIDTISWTLQHDWTRFASIIEGVLDSLPTEQLAAAVKFLVDGVYWAIRSGEATETPRGLAAWLLDQLLRLPDLASPGDTLGWHVEEILKRTGRAPLSWLPKALARRRDMETREGHEKVHALSYHTRVGRFVTPISASDAQDPGVIETANELVTLALGRGTVWFYLPQVLADVDPDGLVIPSEVARRIESANDDDSRSLARIAGAYPIGGPAWRQIAKPAVARAMASADRRPLFSALLPHGITSWSSAPGEVPRLFIEKVQAARQLLESEDDPVFRPFWEWYLALAEAELRREEEEAKEERGE